MTVPDGGPSDVAQVRGVLAVDHGLRAAERLLDTRLWTRGTAEQAAEHLGRARWALLAAECRAGAAAARVDAVAEWERRRRAAQSAELARLLSRFAVRTGVTTPPGEPVRLVLLEDAWRLGDPLRDRPAARVRRELLTCPVVAYGSRPHAWMVFAAPVDISVPAWRVEGRALLTDLGVAAADLGVAAGLGDRSAWRAFGLLLRQGVPGRSALRAARSYRC